MTDMQITVYDHVIFGFTISLLMMDHILADEISRCKTRRIATGQGFHRNITTTVEVTLSKDRQPPCIIHLVEEMPSGAYVDVYQIKTTSDLKVFSEDKIDVEKPEYLSEPHTIHVTSDLTQTNQVLTASVSLPVHLRYHRPSNNATPPEGVQIQHPDILIRCSGDTTVPESSSSQLVKAPCDHTGYQSCDWERLKCTKHQLEALEFPVPVGQTQVRPLVVTGTVLCTVAITLWLGLTMHWNRLGIHSKKD